ncbi:hypothetical protein VTN00DRAFT_4028 [Thermoascus crustaceus]|uniref:uncharacterized protein n=1 Tax=Thermoascus crustaceus TaxID=5088 RepID=UPI0037434BE7
MNISIKYMASERRADEAGGGGVRIRYDTGRDADETVTLGSTKGEEKRPRFCIASACPDRARERAPGPPRGRALGVAPSGAAQRLEHVPAWQRRAERRPSPRLASRLSPPTLPEVPQTNQRRKTGDATQGRILTIAAHRPLSSSVCLLSVLVLRAVSGQSVAALAVRLSRRLSADPARARGEIEPQPDRTRHA